jgi:hypothetical protein
VKRLAVVALAMAMSAPAHAIVNGTVPPDEDTSFDAVGAFAVVWRLGLDPTNPDPATGDHNWYCSATLTAPTVIHTAKHCVEPYGAGAPHAVRFRRALDGSVGTIEAGVASFYHVLVASWDFPGGDVAIGHLVEPVIHIAPIPVLYEDPAPEVYITAPLIVAGWGREGPGPGEGPRTRLRTCDAWIDGVAKFWITFPTAWDPWRNACGANSNDSGGAALVWRAGLLLHVGIISSYGYAVRMSGYPIE